MALFQSDKSAKERSTERATRNRIKDDLAGIDLTRDPNEQSVEVVTSPERKPVKGEVVDVAKRLSGLARSIKSHQRKATQELLACGAALAEAQELLASHKGGTFGKWLTDKVQMSRSTAYNLISLHSKFGGLSKRWTTG